MGGGALAQARALTSPAIVATVAAAPLMDP